MGRIVNHPVQARAKKICCFAHRGQAGASSNLADIILLSPVHEKGGEHEKVIQGNKTWVPSIFFGWPSFPPIIPENRTHSHPSLPPKIRIGHSTTPTLHT